MTQQLVIPHVSRIEGHARITIDLDAAGDVETARLHVTQLRGFEKFTEGRPFYEMPAITARICGICPVSHLLASVKACDMIMAVAIPESAKKLRELLHYAQHVQSHALSFFHLSAPDLILGMDAQVPVRNLLGLAERHPELARDGIALRRFGQSAIERLAGQRVHPSWTVPGGVNAPFKAEDRDAVLADLPAALSIARRALALLKSVLDTFSEEIESFSNLSTMYAGLVDANGDLQIYDGKVRFRGQDGSIVSEFDEPLEYAQYIGEATLHDSYLKAPFYKPLGYPEGLYRVGPLARLNAADRCGTPEADKELSEFRQRLGRCPQSAFYYHYARLIETIWCLERMEVLLHDRAIIAERVRANAGVNAPEGVGIIEAPRGILIHHYKVDPNGAITWANLIVATGHNNLAMNYGVKQVAQHFIKRGVVSEGILNRVCAVVRAYDPCLSCSTHADGRPSLELNIRSAEGCLLKSFRTGE
jgi:NAD-reducing hydrogenase large subunit